MVLWVDVMSYDEMFWALVYHYPVCRARGCMCGALVYPYPVYKVQGVGYVVWTAWYEGDQVAPVNNKMGHKSANLIFVANLC